MPGPTLCNFLPSRSSFHFFSLLISKHLNLQLCRSHNSLSLLALPFFLWVSFYSDLPRQCSISVLYFLYFFLPSTLFMCPPMSRSHWVCLRFFFLFLFYIFVYLCRCFVLNFLLLEIFMLFSPHSL